MKLAAFLKEYLTGLVEVYQNFFLKTIKGVFLLVVVCFIISIPLAIYSNLDKLALSKPVSLLSFFYVRFSYNGIYFYADLVKTIFIFLVSIFSINLIRNHNQNEQAGTLNKLTAKDAVYLLIILISSALLDCALFRLQDQFRDIMTNKNLLAWLFRIIFFLRIYSPLILFSLIIQVCISRKAFSGKEVFLLFISLWFANEVANEITLFVRGEIFEFLLIPFTDKIYRYVIESILGTVLIALYVLGYSYAMTAPFRLSPEESGD